MIATIHNEPEFSELFMTYLLTRNSRIEEYLIDQLFNSSEKRLARLLLLLANFGKEGSPEPIVGKISQETLAEMIGTTRARVSFFMNKFRKLGFTRRSARTSMAHRGTTLPRESASDQSRRPNTATMTERPAISSAVFSLRHRHNLRTATTPLCFRLLPVVVNSVRRSSKSPSKIWCCNDATRGQSARPGSRVWTQT